MRLFDCLYYLGEVKLVAQQKPERINEILKLVDALTSEEHDQLVEEMKLQWLRKAMDESEESIKQHGTIPGEEVFTRLEERYKRKSAQQK